jgi:hypothetical protein
VLERLVDLVVIDLMADVEFHGREADVTVRQSVMCQAKTAGAKWAKRFDWGLAIETIALIGEGHRTSL